MQTELSIIITVFNEEDNIIPMINRIKETFDDTYAYELLFVDDGSTDQTIKTIKDNATKHIRLIEFSRNYGQTTAMAAGIDYAQGDYIALLDGDLQNDPIDIPMMLAKIKEEDWDVVAGERKNRKDGMFLRKIPSQIANSLIRHWTGVHVKDYGCTLKVFKREIAKNLGLYGELHRFIPVLANLQGAKIVQVEVHHRPRLSGISKYGINRTFKVICDLFLILFFQKFLRKPMHLFGGVGLFTFLLGGATWTYLLGLKILGEDIGNRPLFFFGMLLILIGLFFFLMGIMCELLIRIYYHTGNTKPYYIRSIFDGSKNN